MSIYAIVLAAGKGTRMKTEIPKCAFPILKKPMISYVIDSLEKSLVEEPIIVVGHKKEYFTTLVESIQLAYQDEQLGTAHAAKCALPYIKDGITVILPGDAPLISKSIINTLINDHLNNKCALTVGVMTEDNPYGYGRVIMENDNITKIIEEKEATQEEKLIHLVNSGLFVVNNDALRYSLGQVKNNNSKKEYYITDIIEILKDKGVKASFINEPDLLTGINDLKTLATVEEYILNTKVNEALTNGVSLVNKKTIVIGPDVIIEGGATIYPNTVITGKSVIKSGAVIGPNSELHNAYIEENATCRHSVVYDSIIKKNAMVGPFAHLRQNSVVGEEDRIGNFVEMKNSTLGTKTNAAHLTYIGDAQAGDKVNFGCGVITVNYDGKNKNKTYIGSNVFIGCNSNLIAPIKVGNETYIAAGSTVTKDVPDNAFVIARSRQETKENYELKIKKNENEE